jgi:carbamoyl-phosphate synthase small subunit
VAARSSSRRAWSATRRPSRPVLPGADLPLHLPAYRELRVVPGEDESHGIQAAAVLVREYTPYHSNWASERSLGAYLQESGVLGVEGLDTRALTRHLRDKGAMRGVISTSESDSAILKARANTHPLMARPRPRLLELAGDGADLSPGLRRGALSRRRPRLRGKGSIYKELRTGRHGARDARLHRAERSRPEPDGLFLSNAGDPAALAGGEPCVRAREVPVFGICLATSFSVWPWGARRTDAVRAPRGEPPGQEPGERAHRDHEPEPRLRRPRRFAARRRRA